MSLGLRATKLGGRFGGGSFGDIMRFLKSSPCREWFWSINESCKHLTSCEIDSDASGMPFCEVPRLFMNASLSETGLKSESGVTGVSDTLMRFELATSMES